MKPRQKKQYEKEGHEKNNKKIGKKNRASGIRFELKVRKDLESKGWIISKWMNNVEFIDRLEFSGKQSFTDGKKIKEGKLIPSKHKFCGIGRPMAIGTGFPDFIGLMRLAVLDGGVAHEVIGIEVKSNGYLDKIEKEKCKWLLDNKIFSKISIASKGKKRGEIVYKKISCEDAQNP